MNEKVERTAVEAARRKFSPEFMNRLDKVVCFHPLRREQLEEVLDIELGQVQQRVLETAKGQFLFRVTNRGKEFLLQEGTDQRYGARHLKRSIERHVVYPLANLLATEQVHLGDLVCIDWDKSQDRLTFVREGENLAMPVRKLEPAIAAPKPAARSGSRSMLRSPPAPEVAPRSLAKFQVTSPKVRPGGLSPGLFLFGAAGVELSLGLCIYVRLFRRLAFLCCVAASWCPCVRPADTVEAALEHLFAEYGYSGGKQNAQC